MPTLQPLGERLWLLSYPESFFGMELGRNVTLLGLEDGRLVVHSTAPFSPEDRAAIEALGEPGWLLDANLFHDTFRRAGREAFPDLPYLAPEGFPGDHLPLLPAPRDWSGQIEVLELGGMPRLREHAFFHRASGTLVVADLLFHLPTSAGRWTRAMLRIFSGLATFPGSSRTFRFFIRDREAFDASLKRILERPIERIVVGHGETIERDAAETLRSIFSDLGSDV